MFEIVESKCRATFARQSMPRAVHCAVLVTILTAARSCSSYVVTVSSSESASGILRADTAARAAELLSSTGLVHLKSASADGGLIDRGLIRCGARAASDYLNVMMSRLEAIGIAPRDSSFSFAEAVVRPSPLAWHVCG